jgi:predicted nucleic acid-binding protein
MTVFVDTNVLLDVLAEREGFYQYAVQIWTLAESGQLSAHISAISFNNCYYIVRRHADKPSAEKAVRLLRDVFSVVDLTSQILNQAIDAGFTDFEDAIQFHSAVQAKAETIITRNPDHFPRTPFSVLSPREFLKRHPSD